MWGLVICIKMFTNVYLNKVLFIPCEVISLHPRRLMLSESPAVGSVHGHRVGRAAQSRRERTGSADGPRRELRGRPPASSARPAPVPDREQGHDCCGPSSAPSPRGQSCSGLKRRTDVPAVPGSWMQRLRLIVVSPLSTWRKPQKHWMERNSRDGEEFHVGSEGPCQPQHSRGV